MSGSRVYNEWIRVYNEWIKSIMLPILYKI